MAGVSEQDIERVFRAEYGRAVAVLVRVFGDIDIAEEAVQDAFTAAAGRWPSAGLPPSPAGWIITTARNRAIDRLRREASREDKLAQAALLHARESGRRPPKSAVCATGCTFLLDSTQVRKSIWFSIASHFRIQRSQASTIFQFHLPALPQILYPASRTSSAMDHSLWQ